MGGWQYYLFACMEDCPVCCVTWLVPCYTAGKVAETTGRRCVVHALLTSVPIVNVVRGYRVRAAVRESRQIDGSALEDVFTHLGCCWCALCQVVGRFVNLYCSPGFVYVMRRDAGL